MSPEEMRSLVDRYIAAYNAFDVEAMLALLHPEVMFRNVSGGEVNASAEGLEEFRRLADRAAELLESRTQQITAFETSADLATAEIRYEAVLASDLPNGMKAGEQLRLTGRSEFCFRDGRIDRITDYS